MANIALCDNGNIALCDNGNILLCAPCECPCENWPPPESGECSGLLYEYNILNGYQSPCDNADIIIRNYSRFDYFVREYRVVSHVVQADSVESCQWNTTDSSSYEVRKIDDTGTIVEGWSPSNVIFDPLLLDIGTGYCRWELVYGKLGAGKSINITPVGFFESGNSDFALNCYFSTSSPTTHYTKAEVVEPAP